ncbi:MAG: hypothetical protein WC455_28010 [Dehalococcoidia bacterium]|jgi:hypothetical protein
MEAKDFVGWTVTCYDSAIRRPAYCISIKRFDDGEEVLQLDNHHHHNPNLEGHPNGCNWWTRTENCMRLRQGDWTQ